MRIIKSLPLVLVLLLSLVWNEKNFALEGRAENNFFKISVLGISAKRLPHLSSRIYIENLDNKLTLFGKNLDQKTSEISQSQVLNSSVRAHAVRFDEVNWDNVNDLNLDSETSEWMFRYVRDLRFIEHDGYDDGDDENLKQRRVSWLYPDDGCFARSALVQKLIARSGKVSSLQQIFVFGDLSAKTQNSEEGWVTWWYHVAPIYKSNGEIFVIDPAVDPSKTLLLDEWLDLISLDKESLTISLCDKDSYDPSSPCNGNEDDTYSRALSAENNLYLDAEFNRIRDLSRNPALELGEEPPWLKELR